MIPVKPYHFMERMLKLEVIQIQLGELWSGTFLCKMLPSFLFSQHGLGSQVCIHLTQLEALTQDLCGHRNCFWSQYKERDKWIPGMA